MSSKKSTYERRGVSSTKADVHAAIAKLDKGLFPNAFCKILPDILAGSPHHCNILHADTAGTKAGLAYLMYSETGNPRYLKGVAVDALVMNIDDVGCVGATDRLLVNQTIGRNAFLVKDEAIQALIESAEEFCQLMRDWDIDCRFTGGETASVGDIVRTLDVGSSVAARMKRADVIDAGNMKRGDIIVGFSSTGTATWESYKNSGIGANGLTNARHDTLADNYRKQTETFAPQMPKKLVYRGKYQLTDFLPGNDEFSIGEALLFPTRTYLPMINRVLKLVGRKNVHGIIHCSGGGQTKIMQFGGHGNRYVKDNLFPIPRVFQMLKNVSGLSWREMYEVYNMGHRLEIVVPEVNVALAIINCSMNCGIEAQVVGKVKPKLGPGPNKLVIDSPYGTLEYP